VTHTTANQALDPVVVFHHHCVTQVGGVFTAATAIDPAGCVLGPNVKVNHTGNAGKDIAHLTSAKKAAMIAANDQAPVLGEFYEKCKYNGGTVDANMVCQLPNSHSYNISQLNALSARAVHMTSDAHKVNFHDLCQRTNGTMNFLTEVCSTRNSA